MRGERGVERQGRQQGDRRWDVRVQVLRKIVDFAAGEGSQEAQATWRVWRQLSRDERLASDAAVAMPSVADDLVLRVGPGIDPIALYRKLVVYKRALGVPVARCTFEILSADGSSRERSTYACSPDADVGKLLKQLDQSMREALPSFYRDALEMREERPPVDSDEDRWDADLFDSDLDDE